MKKLHIAILAAVTVTGLVAGSALAGATSAGGLLSAWTISRPGPEEGDRVYLAHRAGSTDALYLMFERRGVRIVVDRELASSLSANPLALDVRWPEPDRIVVFKGKEPALSFRVAALTWEAGSAAVRPAR